MDRIDYPILLIPESIAKQLREIPPISNVPVIEMPSPPVFRHAPPRRVNLKPFLPKVIYGGIGLLISFILPILGFPLLAIAFCILIIRISQQLSKFPARERKYQQQRQQHRHNQQKYQNTLVKLEQQKQERDAKIAQWENEIAPVLKSVREFLARTVTPGSSSCAQKGYSEKEFERILRKYFGEGIHTGRTLHNPKFDRGYSYTADFAYIDPSGLHIDIEIDEPYAYQSRKPIHCIGFDEDRNNFFLSCGWIVIRFAEEQVVKYPHSCCRAIAEITCILQGKVLPQIYYQIPVLPHIPQWSWEEATNMADKSHRETYL